MSSSKEFAFRVAAKCMPASVNRRLEQDCLLPYYHMVSDEHVPHVSPLYRFRTVKEFKADVDCLLRSRKPVSVAEFIDSVQNTGAPPPRACLLSFDDGFREMHNIVAPILQAKGAPAIFFLTSATVDNHALCHHQKISLLLDKAQREHARFPLVKIKQSLAEGGITGVENPNDLTKIPWKYRTTLDQLGTICGVDFATYAKEHQPHLTSQQVKSLLDRGFEVGSHSVDHPLYLDLSLAEQLSQTRESTAFLAENFGITRRFFAFPHTDRGVSREFFERVASEAGVEATFGTSGPAQDCCARSFQRFSMEKSDLPAEAILARQNLRFLKLQLTGQTVLQRPAFDGSLSKAVPAVTQRKSLASVPN